MSYECTFICSPELDSAKVEDLVAKVSKIIEAAEGKIKNLQQLGKKKLAYNIKKFREGNYVYVEFDANGSVVLSLENFFKVNDDVIRFLTVKIEEKKKKAVKKVKVVEKKQEVTAEAPVEEKKEETVNAEPTDISDTTAK
ncbi:MAG: 30S ribosomal protein S6 [Elusimicrobia bacterium]|jgi:small subunit ribosomal protein S6|nr:30S ribosomal protein S6 [Elusimicrobiota bacterium]